MSALGRYIEHGREVDGTARRAPGGRRGAAAVDTAKVREWAKENGHDIKDRGRVPAGLLTEYQAAPRVSVWVRNALTAAASSVICCPPSIQVVTDASQTDRVSRGRIVQHSST
jgi:hypothetical protein